MLQVDLYEPDEKVAALISSQCANQGSAVSVNIFRAPIPFAIIAMTDSAQSVQVAQKLEACTFGRYVIVNLEHVSANNDGSSDPRGSALQEQSSPCNPACGQR